MSHTKEKWEYFEQVKGFGIRDETGLLFVSKIGDERRACLMAAAPDLLKICKRIYQEDFIFGFPDVLRDALAAEIAKAEGK